MMKRKTNLRLLKIKPKRIRKLKMQRKQPMLPRLLLRSRLNQRLPKRKLNTKRKKHYVIKMQEIKLPRKMQRRERKMLLQQILRMKK